MHYTGSSPAGEQAPWRSSACRTSQTYHLIPSATWGAISNNGGMSNDPACPAWLGCRADVATDAARAGAARAASTSLTPLRRGVAPRSSSRRSRRSSAAPPTRPTPPLLTCPADALRRRRVGPAGRPVPTPGHNRRRGRGLPAVLVTDAAAAAEHSTDRQRHQPGDCDRRPRRSSLPGAHARQQRAAQRTLTTPSPPLCNLPPAAPRPWSPLAAVLSREGRGRVQVAGLGINFHGPRDRARSSSPTLTWASARLLAERDPDPTMPPAPFPIPAGLEEPQAGRIVAAPRARWPHRLAAALLGR